MTVAHLTVLAVLVLIVLAVIVAALVALIRWLNAGTRLRNEQRQHAQIPDAGGPASRR